MFSTVYLVWITYRYLQSFFLRNTTVPSPPKINTQLPHQMKVGNHGKTWEIMERVLFDDLGHFRSCSKHGLGIGNMWIWHEEYLENPNCKTSTISLMPLFPCSSNIKKKCLFRCTSVHEAYFFVFPAISHGMSTLAAKVFGARCAKGRKNHELRFVGRLTNNLVV